MTMKPGKAIHPINGTGTAPDASSTPSGVEISFDGGPNKSNQTTELILLFNAEGTSGNVLEVSFSDGRLWFQVPPQQVISFPIMVHRCRLRGLSGATSDYSILGIIA